MTNNNNDCLPSYSFHLCHRKRVFSNALLCSSVIKEQAGSLCGWRCYTSYADVGDISSQRGMDYNGGHISETRTMRSEIDYVHRQFGRTLLNFL